MNIRMGVASVGLAALIVLASCAGSPRQVTVNVGGFHAAAAELTAELQLEGREEEVVTGAVEDFLDFLAQEYRRDFIDSMARIRRPSDLGDYLASKDGATTHRKVLDAFAVWDKDRRDQRWDEAKAERTETAHFLLLTMPGTAAHRERDFLARAAEEYFEASAVILSPDDTSAGRFHANMAALSGGKIVIALSPNSRPLGRANGISTTNYGFSATTDGALRIQATIRIPYYNALSTTALAHEIVHVRDILQKIDLSTAPWTGGGPAGKSDTDKKAFKAWAQDTFARVVPNDRTFGEGIAEYASARINPIRRAFYLAPDEELRTMSTQVSLVNDILSRPISVKDRRVRLLRYTELHSFVAFLIDTYGAKRFFDFYARVPPDEASFFAAYGTGFAGMQTRWNEARR